MAKQAHRPGSAPAGQIGQEEGDSGVGGGPARQLQLLPAFALVAGSMLGIGIFITPSKVAAGVNGPWGFLGMWLLGGIAALCGALALAELGAMMPRSGGDYAYLRRAWGPGTAYAAGWLQLLVIFPGSLASVAVATASFQLPVLFRQFTGTPMPEVLTFAGASVATPHLCAALLIVGLTILNHVGVRISGVVQVIVVSIPLLVLLVSSISVLAGDEVSTLGSAPPPKTAGLDLGDIGRAYLGVYFAYSGWNAAIYVGGEIQDPGRNLPRSLLGGTGVVTAVYVVLCMGFLAVFGFDALRDVGEVGTAAAVALYGDAGVTAITALIFLAMVGSLNGTTMIGSRIAYAMSLQGDCFPACGRLDGRFGTPAVALWLQAGISIVLLAFVPDLDVLIDYTTSAMLITGTLTVMAVVVLRRREPELPRPYRVFAYPWPPILYGVSSLAVLLIVILDREPSVLVAVAWFAGALLWYRWRRRG